VWTSETVAANKFKCDDERSRRRRLSGHSGAAMMNDGTTAGRRHGTRKRTTRLCGRGKQTGGRAAVTTTRHSPPQRRAHAVRVSVVTGTCSWRQRRPMRTRRRGVCVWMSWRRKIISNPPHARGQLPFRRGNDIPSSLRPTTLVTPDPAPQRSTNPLCAVYFYFIFFTHILRESERCCLRVL